MELETVKETFINSSEFSAEKISTLPLNIPYFISELVVALFATVGNGMTLYVFFMDRRLRRITNYYIAALALADLLVGVLAIPFAIIVSVGLPRSLWPCLFMISSLIVLCAISIFCLLAVSIDRYLAILHPIAYSRRMTKKVAKRIIWFCWFIGAIVGLLPVFGWYKETKDICFFVRIVDYNYLVFFYFSFIIIPGLLMSFFYARIFSVVVERERRYVRSRHGMLRHIESQKNACKSDSKETLESGPDPPPTENQDSSLLFVARLRLFFINVGLPLSLGRVGRKTDTYEVSTEKRDESDTEFQDDDQNNCQNVTSTKVPNPQNGRASKKEIKAAQNLSIIILFFFVCWFPINTINCIQAFCPDCYVPLELLYFTIMLSHANSAVNPLLYAYNMKDFRRSLKVHVFKSLNLKIGKTVAVTSSVSSPSSTVQEVKLTPTTSPKVDPMSLEPCLEISCSSPSDLSTSDEKYKFPSSDKDQNSVMEKETILPPTSSYHRNVLLPRGIFSSNLPLSSFASQPSLQDLDSFKVKMKRDYYSLEGKGDLLTSLLNENQTKNEADENFIEGRKADYLNFKNNARNTNALKPRYHLQTQYNHSLSQSDLSNLKLYEKT